MPPPVTPGTPAARKLSICVFCGARPGLSPLGPPVAEAVGAALGLRGHRLVYGAGGVGLMGSLARGALRAGAEVTGIIPPSLLEIERPLLEPGQRLVVTEDMFERKRLMIDQADAFIALPGGYGTLDEILEVVSLSYLGECPKPITLLNVDGIFDNLFALFADIHRRGFTRGGPPLFHVSATVDEALDHIESRLAAGMLGAA